MTLASHMLVLAKVCDTLEEAKDKLQEVIKNGKAIEKLQEWVSLQGGNPAAVLDYSLLPTAKYQQPVTLDQVGYVAGIEAESVGKSALVLGAGRETKESLIDLSVGIVLHKKIGDAIGEDDVVATIYYNDLEKCQAAEAILKAAYSVSNEKIEPNTLIYKVIKA